jgi:hypothetical protein
MVQWNSSRPTWTVKRNQTANRTVIPDWKQIEDIQTGVLIPIAKARDGEMGSGIVGKDWRLVQDTTPSGRNVLVLEYIGGDTPQIVQVFQA